MEIAAEGPAPGESMAGPARAAELVRVGLSAGAVAAAIGAVAGFAALLIGHHADWELVPFQGWQVWMVEALLGAVLIAATVFAARWARGHYRSVRDRTPYRRAVVMAVVVPAFVAGAFVGQSLRPAITWASNHTSAAAEEHRAYVYLLHQSTLAPLAASVSQPRAPRDLARHLLRPMFAGSNWYPATQPNPTSRTLPPDAIQAGGIARAANFLTQQHRVGAQWSLDMSVLETETVFDNPADAVAYLRHERAARASCSCADADAVFARTHVGGVTVWKQSSVDNSSRHVWADFVIHDRLYTVLAYRWKAAPGEVDLSSPVRQAVLAAAHPF